MKHWYEGETMIKEALAYFSDDTSYHRLFSLFKKKYESLGRIGGTVKVDHFTVEELVAIARFFGLTVTELRQKGKISLEGFDKQLQSTKFVGVNLKTLLEAYFNEPLYSKMEKKQLKASQQKQWLDKMESDYPALAFWINYIRRKTPDTYWIYRMMEESFDQFLKKVRHLEQAYNHLPIQFERLPLFSQRITRDPHAFDLNTNTGRLWVHLLAVNYYNSKSVIVPTDSEGINDLLLAYRILRDDITNYVTCVNLVAETEKGIHSMWESAAETHSVMNTPLRELIPLERIYPLNKHKSVWIVENSGVYSSILDKLPEVPLICTHGQFKLASLLLIDLLVKDGCTLYYAGDLDPEGIGMADRLLRRHPEHVQLWHMDVSSYHKCESQIEVSAGRLNKLDAVEAPGLVGVAQELKKRKRAGYQEALVDEMVLELERKIKSS
ncbi:TIGR02679 family protein [Oceanobacillus senegalensis]|uniref:TIGR02679 family protein n=1 Tax=Oceanobacillus senegalensis TaxID=1936063 RepID=UPI000A3099C4|nr:TIGR02679 family protein [Oceanobacillus senegalensis]